MLSNFVKSLLVFVFAVAIFSACQKDDAFTLDNNQNESNTSFFSLAGNAGTGGGSDTAMIECFDFIYPITILLPDGNSEVLNSLDALEDLIDQWFEDNPYSEEDPTFQFPVKVILEDNTQQSISDEEALCDLYEECDYFEEECFEIIYPVDLRFPDGQTQTFNSEDELEDALDAWEASADPDSKVYPDFVYPIEVSFEDGSTETLTSLEELTKLEEECYEDYYDEEYDDFDDEECYELVFPLSIQLPEGAVELADNEEALYNILDDWEANAAPNTEEYPDFVYPIEVILENDSTVSIENTQAFEELEDECYDDFDFEDCFTVNFPIQVEMPDETIITGSSEDELFDQIETWYDQNEAEEEDPEIVFPISITLDSDGSTVEVNDEDSLEDILYSCFGDDFDYEIYATHGSTKTLMKMEERKTNQSTQSVRR
ncbi:MAG: hypothetical protein Sapg2KO_16050 [Saprospiraceae bacterium]